MSDPQFFVLIGTLWALVAACSESDSPYVVVADVTSIGWYVAALVVWVFA